MRGGKLFKLIKCYKQIPSHLKQIIRNFFLCCLNKKYLDYDALLTWPFKHKITITLLDQV